MAKFCNLKNGNKKFKGLINSEKDIQLKKEDAKIVLAQNLSRIKFVWTL